jgi:hypothetical protein
MKIAMTARMAVTRFRPVCTREAGRTYAAALMVRIKSASTGNAAPMSALLSLVHGAWHACTSAAQVQNERTARIANARHAPAAKVRRLAREKEMLANNGLPSQSYAIQLVATANDTTTSRPMSQLRTGAKSHIARSVFQRLEI